MDTLNRSQVDASHFTLRVTWSAEDGEFVATCLEFPSLSWLAPARNEAIEGLERLIVEVVDDMRANQERVPEPYAERKYSGTFNNTERVAVPVLGDERQRRRDLEGRAPAVVLGGVLAMRICPSPATRPAGDPTRPDLTSRGRADLRFCRRPKSPQNQFGDSVASPGGAAYGYHYI